MKTRAALHGFTLIEVIIVLVIVGLLATVAYPSYTEHLRKARRAEAQAALHELAQHMERHYSRNGTYLDAQLPFLEVPRDGARRYYDLDFPDEITDTTYTLRASPKGIMTGDACGNLHLLHTGRRSQGDDANKPPDRNCWRH